MIATIHPVLLHRLILRCQIFYSFVRNSLLNFNRRIIQVFFGARRRLLLERLPPHIKLVCCRIFGRRNWRFIRKRFASRNVIHTNFVHMDSLGPDKAFKFFIISDCLTLILITLELIASTRDIMMCPSLESFLHILNLVKDHRRCLNLLRTNLHGLLKVGDLKVLLTSLALPKWLMRVHVVEEHFVISTSLLATICSTLIKIVK